MTLSADGDEPITWTVVSGSLPAGLTLNPNTGAISGTPTATGRANFTVEAANSEGTDTKALSILINGAGGSVGGGGGGGGGGSTRPTDAPTSPTTATSPSTTPSDSGSGDSGGGASGPDTAVFNYPLLQPTASAGTHEGGVKSSNPLIVNGEEKDFPAVNLQGYNWLKLRDFAAILNGTGKQFSIGYDEATKTISITTGSSYSPLGDELQDNLADAIDAIVSPQHILLNGKVVNVAAYNIEGYNYFRLRDLAIMLDIGVEFDDDTKEVTLHLDAPYKED